MTCGLGKRGRIGERKGLGGMDEQALEVASSGVCQPARAQGSRLGGKAAELLAQGQQPRLASGEGVAQQGQGGAEADQEVVAGRGQAGAKANEGGSAFQDGFGIAATQRLEEGGGAAEDGLQGGIGRRSECSHGGQECAESVEVDLWRQVGCQARTPAFGLGRESARWQAWDAHVAVAERDRSVTQGVAQVEVGLAEGEAKRRQDALVGDDGDHALRGIEVERSWQGRQNRQGRCRGGETREEEPGHSGHVHVAASRGVAG